MCKVKTQYVFGGDKRTKRKQQLNTKCMNVNCRNLCVTDMLMALNELAWKANLSSSARLSLLCLKNCNRYKMFHNKLIGFNKKEN